MYMKVYVAWCFYSVRKGLVHLMNVLFWGWCDFQITVLGRDMSRNVWNRLLERFLVGTMILSNNMESPLPNVTRHSGGWPSHKCLTLLLKWILLPNLSFYLVAQCSHIIFAIGYDMPAKDAYFYGHLVMSHLWTCRCFNVVTNPS